MLMLNIRARSRIRWLQLLRSAHPGLLAVFVCIIYFKAIAVCTQLRHEIGVARS
ncbi:hypothetical protein FIBSPDRAFT_228044 [Athelia psychrophila]|uniref:Uncharacterized protein n=1 Tax=Athelia psychrophila TaxID=1759441 RepID=A0A165YTI6_9AGAM|nr:hypothetical protein FIBSPDRAFT_228044 [Fibularhizoctonia sp. CBS 109695]